MDDETLQIIASASHLASVTGQEKESFELVECLRVAVPDDETVETLRASAFIFASRFDEGEKILRDNVLAKNPENWRAKSLLGIALHGSGRATERDRVLQEVIDAKPEDVSALEIAESLLHT
ncbi:MAG: hypothetical protein AAF713_02670 [Pseudomonadota bacterium]